MLPFSLIVPGIIIGLILLVIITRPFTVLFHELGHAIPAILLTRQKVTIYLGSHGDTRRSVKVKLGLLEVWVKFSLFWQAGLCVPSANEISVNRRLIYVVCGPLASLLIAVMGAYLIFRFDLHGSLKLLIVFFLGSSVFDLFLNLIPNSTPITLHDGSITYNDGYALKHLLWYKKSEGKYEEGVKYYLNGDHTNALQAFQHILDQGLESQELYRLTIHSLLFTRQYERALAVHHRFAEAYPLVANDHIHAGMAKTYLNQHEEGMLEYERALEMDPCHSIALNNVGYTLTVLERYAEAIPLLDKAIEVDPELSYAYNNRGYARMKLGAAEEGLKDIQYALQLDSKNAYAYRNLGIYHLEQGEMEKALRQFSLARELDPGTQMLDTMIEQATSGLSLTK